MCSKLRAPVDPPRMRRATRAFMPSTIRIVIHSWMGLPLIARDKIIGSLALSSDQPNAFDESQVRLAMAIANQAAAAHRKRPIFQDTWNTHENGPHLHAASQQLARIQEDIEQVYNIHTPGGGETRAGRNLPISLLDEKRGQIDGVYLYDRPPARSRSYTSRPDAGFSGQRSFRAASRLDRR